MYVLNANGLSLDHRGGQYDVLCQVAKEVQADIMGCQEHTNVDASHQSLAKHLAPNNTPTLAAGTFGGRVNTNSFRINV